MASLWPDWDSTRVLLHVSFPSSNKLTASDWSARNQVRPSSSVLPDCHFSFLLCRAGFRASPLLKAPPVLPWALPQQEHLEEHVRARLHLVSHLTLLTLFQQRSSLESLLCVCAVSHLQLWLPLPHISCLKCCETHLCSSFLFKTCLETRVLTLLFLCPSSLRFISHGISHCYSSFRGDVRGTAPSFYWTYLLSVCAGGGAWLLLWTTVDRCGRRGILLLSMTMTGLASLILLGLMECKPALVGSRIVFSK